jgi:deoxyribonuclease-4
MTPLLGAHISIAGGTQNAPARAKIIGATAMQIFTKMANRWAERTCEADECNTFRQELAKTQIKVISAHDSYLINLASPDPVLRRRSMESFILELRRCEALGLQYLVSHPGNYIDDRDAGIKRNAEAIGLALEQVPGKTKLLMEMTAGSGTAIGSTFEEIAELIDLVPRTIRKRMGVCIDTAHIFAAGYDISNDYEGVMRHFDDTVGLKKLKMMHLNDSKAPLGSHRDRHELIGEGQIGERAFRHIMNDPRLAKVAKVIETPKKEENVTDQLMLERLRSYED